MPSPDQRLDSFAKLISLLLSWGYGSGEEFYDWLLRHGLTEAEAGHTLEHLNHALARAREEVGG